LLAHIDDYIAKEEDTLEPRLWMFSEIARWEDKAIAIRYGQRVIEYCEQNGCADEAARTQLICKTLSASLQDHVPKNVP